MFVDLGWVNVVTSFRPVELGIVSSVDGGCQKEESGEFHIGGIITQK